MINRWLDVLFHRTRDNISGDFLRQTVAKLIGGVQRPCHQFCCAAGFMILLV
jgi:hypothetical protein